MIFLGQQIKINAKMTFTGYNNDFFILCISGPLKQTNQSNLFSLNLKISKYTNICSDHNIDRRSQKSFFTPDYLPIHLMANCIIKSNKLDGNRWSVKFTGRNLCFLERSYSALSVESRLSSGDSEHRGLGCMLVLKLATF